MFGTVTGNGLPTRNEDLMGLLIRFRAGQNGLAAADYAPGTFGKNANSVQQQG